MRAILKKEVFIGIIISAIIFSICFYLASWGGNGPCNGGLGIIMDFFILIAVMVISGICMMLRDPQISLIAQTVLLLTFIVLAFLSILTWFF